MTDPTGGEGAGPSSPAQQTEAETEEAASARRRYVRDLIIRGEAVETDAKELPPGATHRIVGKDEQGEPIVKRERFTAY